MEKQIQINYKYGQMKINLEQFFPTSQKNCKKLMSIISMDWEHQDELIQSIIQWMTGEKKVSEQEAAHYDAFSAVHAGYVAKFRSVNAKVKRLQKNIEILKDRK